MKYFFYITILAGFLFIPSFVSAGGYGFQIDLMTWEQSEDAVNEMNKKCSQNNAKLDALLYAVNDLARAGVSTTDSRYIKADKKYMDAYYKCTSEVSDKHFFKSMQIYNPGISEKKFEKKMRSCNAVQVKKAKKMYGGENSAYGKALRKVNELSESDPSYTKWNNILNKEGAKIGKKIDEQRINFLNCISK